jgi:hypothetical protein
MPKVEAWRFVFWTIWKAERGQPYAERHELGDVATARQAHRAALDFHWVLRGMTAASVTELLANAGDRDQPIAEGGRKDELPPAGPGIGRLGR